MLISEMRKPEDAMKVRSDPLNIVLSQQRLDWYL